MQFLIKEPNPAKPPFDFIYFVFNDCSIQLLVVSDAENGSVAGHTTHPVTATKPSTAGTKWGRFMGNGTENVMNGGPAVQLQNVQPAPTEQSESTEEETTLTTSDSQLKLLATLQEIRSEIRHEVDVLTQRMNKIGNQIEYVLTSLKDSASKEKAKQQSALPVIVRQASVDDGRESPHSSSSLTNNKPPKKMSKKVNKSRVSPQPPSISDESPTRSKGKERAGSLVSSETSVTMASGNTLATTVDMEEPINPPRKSSYARKEKIKDLDML